METYMKYCTKCGNELVDEAAFCPRCGCAVPGATISNFVRDVPDIVFRILGFFIPLLGLIGYFLLRPTDPKKANAAGLGALLSVIISISLVILVLIATALTV